MRRNGSDSRHIHRIREGAPDGEETLGSRVEEFGQIQ
jgi:hypothetical protein